MKEIPGIEKLKTISPDLSLSDFRLIKRLVLDHQEHTAVLSCSLATDQLSPAVLIKMKFECISNLKIAEFGDFESRVDSFDVRDISSNGWEDKSWETIDFEEDRIHWFSKMVEIVSAELI